MIIHFYPIITIEMSRPSVPKIPDIYIPTQSVPATCPRKKINKKNSRNKLPEKYPSWPSNTQKLAPVFVRHCQAISKHCQSLQSLSLRVQDESVAMDELDNDVLQNLFQCCPKLNQVIYKYTKYTRGNLPEVQFTKRQTRIDPSKISVEIVGN